MVCKVPPSLAGDPGPFPFDPRYEEHFRAAAARRAVLVLEGDVLANSDEWYRAFQVDTRSLLPATDAAGRYLYGMPTELYVRAQRVCQQYAIGGVPRAGDLGYTMEHNKLWFFTRTQPHSMDRFDPVLDQITADFSAYVVDDFFGPHRQPLGVG